MVALYIWKPHAFRSLTAKPRPTPRKPFPATRRSYAAARHYVGPLDPGDEARLGDNAAVAADGLAVRRCRAAAVSLRGGKTAASVAGIPARSRAWNPWHWRRPGHTNPRRGRHVGI